MVDQPYNRIKLATKHLDIALWFFLERQNFSSTLKLAGAAEEAFRKALSSHNAQLALTPMASASGPFVTVDDLEYAAIWAIVRACGKYKCLGLPPTARMLEFDNWVYENMVGCSNEEVDNFEEFVAQQ